MLGLLLADGGEGEDFLTGQPDFFTKTAVTPERKVEKSFPRSEIKPRAKNGSLTKIGIVWQKSAKISFNIILLNSAIRIIAIFLLIDLFVFSS